MTPFERRILDISYKHQLSHIGSCLTAVGIIEQIYSRKAKKDRFVLSCGHAGLALYVVLEKHGLADAEELYLKHGVHPNCDVENGIDCSTGSLGQGICIALGMAMANRDILVWCLVSDGECSEGSVYEALNVALKYNVENLRVYCNYNGWGAYDPAKLPWLAIVNTTQHWFMQKYGQGAHYKVLNQPEYEACLLQ